MGEFPTYPKDAMFKRLGRVISIATTMRGSGHYIPVTVATLAFSMLSVANKLNEGHGRLTVTRLSSSTSRKILDRSRTQCGDAGRAQCPAVTEVFSITFLGDTLWPAWAQEVETI